jgi:hypothetical protein
MMILESRYHKSEGFTSGKSPEGTGKFPGFDANALY